MFIEEADENGNESDQFYSEDKKQKFQQIDKVICPEERSAKRLKM